MITVKSTFMQLNIEGTKSIQEVQREFNEAFPFLKIEFFKPLFGHSFSTDAKSKLLHSTQIKEARRLQHDGCLEIVDVMKVAELERTFKDEYGLNVQVFRKSGNVWLETTMTDNWTLKQQNDHGREISTPF